MSGAMRLQQARSQEPIFSPAWPALVLVAVIVVGYALQPKAGPEYEQLVTDFGLTPINLFQGRVGELFSHMFLHGGWGHALANAAFALIFATPLARMMGTSLPRGM